MSLPHRQEAVMAQAIPSQHPAVVLRSHYRQLRALLAVAMIAVVRLSAALVIVAIDEDAATTDSAAQLISPAGSIRYDGGPEEGTRGAITNTGAGAVASGAPSFGTRYDGGPEEGTAVAATAASSGAPS